MKIDNMGTKDIYTYLKKDDITRLCEYIKMPNEVTQKVCGLIDSFDFSIISPYYYKLFCVDTGNEGVLDINTVVENNEDKEFIWLTIYLAAVLDVKIKYDYMGIDEQIYYDTMAIFSRFVREHKVSFGVYGYDRQWWNYRQIACTLFRIGELEYERYVYKNEDAFVNGEKVIAINENVISIHIPSDARITPKNCKSSLKAAVDFFDKCWSSFEYNVLYCHSWIISPKLKDVLDENSNIVKFLENFEIFKYSDEATGYIKWVFKNDKLSIDEFPQETSLQRNIVKYMKQGGKIGEAAGIIRKSATNSGN